MSRYWNLSQNNRILNIWNDEANRVCSINTTDISIVLLADLHTRDDDETSVYEDLDYIEYCRKNKRNIADMARILSQSEFREEAKALYIGYIRSRAAANFDRRGYSETAELLSNFMGCFGAKAAGNLSEELRYKYNNRPAFLDKLDKAGL